MCLKKLFQEFENSFFVSLELSVLAIENLWARFIQNLADFEFRTDILCKVRPYTYLRYTLKLLEDYKDFNILFIFLLEVTFRRLKI